jgi:hypothetical protein
MWVPKTIMGEHEMQRVASALTQTLLELYHKVGNEFLKDIESAIDETYISFKNAGTKQESKQ